MAQTENAATTNAGDGAIQDQIDQLDRRYGALIVDGSIQRRNLGEST